MRAVLAAAALGFLVPSATAGSASQPLVVTARVTSSALSECAARIDPLALTCRSSGPAAPTYLVPRADSLSSFVPDGWLAMPERNVGYGSVYAASLTTRLIRYDDWEYVETLVSW